MTDMSLEPAERDPFKDYTDKPSFPEKSDEKEGTAPPFAYDRDPHDGGFVAWLVVLGVWCTSFCSFGWINSSSLALLFFTCDLLGRLTYH